MPEPCERPDRSPATYGRRLDDFTRFHDGYQGDQPAQRKIYLLDWRLSLLQCCTGNEREVSQVGVTKSDGSSAASRPLRQFSEAFVNTSTMSILLLDQAASTRLPPDLWPSVRYPTEGRSESRPNDLSKFPLGQPGALYSYHGWFAAKPPL